MWPLRVAWGSHIMAAGFLQSKCLKSKLERRRQKLHASYDAAAEAPEHCCRYIQLVPKDARPAPLPGEGSQAPPECEGSTTSRQTGS